MILVALGIYLYLALSSYSPADPGWTSTGSSGEVSNTVGRLGAWLADVLFLLFGYLAYLFPVMLVYRAIILFRERKEDSPFSWELFGIRAAGFILTLISATTLASMHFLGNLPETAGGIIGSGLISLLLPIVKEAGMSVIFLCLLLVGLSFATGLSWMKVVDGTGRLCLTLYEQAVERWEAWRENALEKQEARKAIEKRKQAMDHFVEKDKNRKPIAIAPVRKAVREPSKRVQREKQGKLFTSEAVGDLPAINVLDDWRGNTDVGYSTEALEAMSRLLEIKLKDFGIEINVEAINPGPVITRFEVQPAPGVKASRITNLGRDLASSLAVSSVRVV